jgi:Ca-activated chloride channel family protein
MKKSTRIVIALVVLLATVLACTTSPAPSPAATSAPAADPNAFHIVANSDVQTLANAGIFADFAKSTGGFTVDMAYKGSVDISHAISALSSDNPKTVDAFWPGSTLQIPISPSVTPASIMKSYVILAVDQSVASSLGWDTTKGITISDLIKAVDDTKIQLAMTSASQSNSGQTFYMAMLTGLCGKSVLTSDCLDMQTVKDGIKTFLSGVVCKNSSTGFLSDSYVKDSLAGTNKCNAIVTYESEVISMNKQLVAGNKPPLTVFYVGGATAVADEPFMYVDNGSATKLDQYKALVVYLQTAPVQAKMQALGWRTNAIGMTLINADQTVFNPAWGINTTTDFPLMVYPKAGTVTTAIDAYQVAFRKPSATIYCLDNSGSMDTNGGRKQMVDAMDLVLNQDRAAQVELQATSLDMSLVYAFSDHTETVGSVTGNDPTALKVLSAKVANTDLGGGTGMFDCLSKALDYAGDHYDASFAWEIIAMTDGGSNQGMSSGEFTSKWQVFQQKTGISIPVYAIAFGNDVDHAQLETLKATGGAVYDGTSNVAAAFRNAKGNN